MSDETPIHSADYASPLVYVAGPITGNPFGCVRESIPAFKWLLDLGCLGFMPQWTVLAEMIEPLPYETYLAYDFGVIRHCQGLLRMPGHSPGADREVAFANRLGIPVFFWDDVMSRQACEVWVATKPLDLDGNRGDSGDLTH